MQALKRKRILYIVQHRLGRSPGQRFRCEQYLSFLQESGFDITYSNIISEKDDQTFYSSGKYLQKLLIVAKTFMTRFRDLSRAKDSDIVFIYREAIMLGSLFFEKKLKKKKAKIIFDFDDSIWLNDVSDGNKNLSWLKNPSKTAEICRLADLVIVGNQYLADYAKQYNDKVAIVPTTIDTAYHSSTATQPKETVCIGWTGTTTTLKHFRTIEPILLRLKEKYGDKICFRLINNVAYSNSALGLETTFWDKDKEIQQLEAIDIGIMPLPNDKWSKGKCGFKGLQYMALGIPTIMSPVGVNTDIIQHRKNGFLAETDDQWFEVLSELIDDKQLRQNIGSQGRKTVVERFSVNSQKQKYVALFHNLIGEK